MSRPVHSMLPLLLSVISVSVNALPDHLLLVQTVIRHADRAPLRQFATDESEKVFFRGKGELSDEGIDNAYNQGVAFRERYVDTGFIDPRMMPSQLEIRSSPVSRVVISAASFSAGLFNKTESGAPRLPPIQTRDKNEDTMLMPPLNCLDGWDDIFDDYNVTSEREVQGDDGRQWKWISKNGVVLPAIIKKHLPDDCKAVTPTLIEPLVAEADNPHVHLPSDLLPCARNGAKHLFFKYIGVLAGVGGVSDLRVRRSAGQLTVMLIDNMRKMLNCSDDCSATPKFRVFFTHDVNIIALGQIFDVLDMFKGRTEFSSSFVFELRNGTAGPYVKLYLKNGVDADFVESNSCATNCTVDVFERLTKKYAVHTAETCVLQRSYAASFFTGGLLVLIFVTLWSRL